MGIFPLQLERQLMKKKLIFPGFVSILLLVSLSACSLFTQNPTEILGLDQTAIAGTVISLQTQLAIQPVDQGTTAAATLQPSATLQPTAALPTATFSPAATEIPAYRVGNVIDVTYLDNATVTAGSGFIKTWRLENTGSQTWGDTFKLIFESGDAMGGPASQPLGKAVSPGQTIDISVSLVAPVTPKTYRGNWMLATDSGTKFGIGANADKPFWVQVVVVTNFAVTSAKPNAVASYNAACPGVILLTATITTTAAGMVTYHYVVNGVDTESLSTSFTEAGTITTPASNYPVTVTGPLNIQVYIDEPNHQLFPTTLNIPVTCTP
jgi:hypothetical protein